GTRPGRGGGERPSRGRSPHRRARQRRRGVRVCQRRVPHRRGAYGRVTPLRSVGTDARAHVSPRHPSRRSREPGAPGHAGDEARVRGPRTAGERRGGRDRAIRGTIDGKVRTMSEQLEEAEATPAVFDTIEGAIEDLRDGKIVLVVDDADRENEGDFIIAAERCTPEAVNFIVTHGRGIVCLPVAGWRLDELQIPQMVSSNGGDETAFTVSIDYAPSTTTGTSAYDRSATARAIAGPGT